MGVSAMWTIPDKGEGDNDIQSILFQEYLETLVAGVDGLDCVLVGCAVTGAGQHDPQRCQRRGAVERDVVPGDGGPGDD
ncbi:MAG: hypothetical protein IPH53_20600 [Flavobacteriales bacterium]|nr:hypothetical protein [Flavobacteriales bacterium]